MVITYRIKEKKKWNEKKEREIMLYFIGDWSHAHCLYTVFVS